eukprot:CAMPEP_0195622912 /NCGR_PEP_ID=MMETSP0815-20121206/16467_1 /TAXON_ID=97485 /ORGANISM="Prymnesium parvum, Strain Texoma1" /LENGTH=142 /DNA_ID=CAMNT_0040763743 /DNA_START=518 /DNA_END=943 /DNA_ORIENTATION=-
MMEPARGKVPLDGTIAIIGVVDAQLLGFDALSVSQGVKHSNNVIVCLGRGLAVIFLESLERQRLRRWVGRGRGGRQPSLRQLHCCWCGVNDGRLRRIPMANGDEGAASITLAGVDYTSLISEIQLARLHEPFNLSLGVLARR